MLKPIPICINLDDAATRLNVDRKWLLQWLRRHPCDESRKPFYRMMGRTKLFTMDDFLRMHSMMGKKLVQRPPAEEGVIYFVASGDFIKIGFSRSMERRMQKFFTESPLPAVLLHSEPGTFKTEKVLHRQFAHLREKGEWFRQGDDLLAYIETRRRLFCNQEYAP